MEGPTTVEIISQTIRDHRSEEYLEEHEYIVSEVSTLVREFYEQKIPYRIFHGSSNSTRPRASANFVDISGLSNVCYVNPKDKYALVEPNVPMDALVEATLAYSLVPPVVMEFPGITAGGGFSGTCGESSSFRHGFFNENVLEVELVLGNGEVITASKAEHEDLFKGAGGALGTLGIVTLMKLRLVEAKKYVHAKYLRVNTVSKSVERIRSMSETTSSDYLDGIVYAKHHGVIVTGDLTNEIPDGVKLQTFSNAADPWFYMHVREKTKRISGGSIVEEYIPLAEYLFRYDRGGFWVGEQGYTYFKCIPFTRFCRWLLDDFSHTRTLYHALHSSGVASQFVVQDITVVYRNAEKLIDHISDDLGIWPLWLCPLAPSLVSSFHPVIAKDAEKDGVMSEAMLSLGVWGWGPSDPIEFIAKNRALEAKLQELRGKKWLYAHTYYTEKEFWDVYDRSWYDALREKYHATSLPNVYDKVKQRQGGTGWGKALSQMWPVGGIYGMCRALSSGDYRKHRDAKWKWQA